MAERTQPLDAAPLEDASASRDSVFSRMKGHAGRVAGHWLPQAVQAWLAADGLRIAAAMSFYAMLSAAPLLMVIVAGLGWWLDQNTVEASVMGQVRDVMGERTAELLSQAMRSASTASEGLIASLIAFGVLLSGASSVFVALQDALKSIWGASADKKPWWHMLVMRLRGAAYLLVLGVLLAASLAATAALSILSNWLSQYLAYAPLWRWLNELVSFALVVVLFFGLMRVCDGRKPADRFLWGGALFSALLFSVGKNLMAAYLSGAAMVSAYGAAGSLVMLLMWMYFSFAILLLGASLAKALALAKAPEESGEVAVQADGGSGQSV